MPLLITLPSTCPVKKFSEPVAMDEPWPDPPFAALEVPTAEMERPPALALTVPAPLPVPWPAMQNKSSQSSHLLGQWIRFDSKNILTLVKKRIRKTNRPSADTTGMSVKLIGRVCHGHGQNHGQNWKNSHLIKIWKFKNLVGVVFFKCRIALPCSFLLIEFYDAEEEERIEWRCVAGSTGTGLGQNALLLYARQPLVETQLFMKQVEPEMWRWANGDNQPRFHTNTPWARFFMVLPLLGFSSSVATFINTACTWLYLINRKLELNDLDNFLIKRSNWYFEPSVKKNITNNIYFYVDGAII